MPMQRINFATRSDPDRSSNVNSQRLVNLYPESKPADSKTQVTLHGTPGLKLWGTAGTGPIRALYNPGHSYTSTAGAPQDTFVIVSGSDVYWGSDAFTPIYGVPVYQPAGHTGISLSDPVTISYNKTFTVYSTPSGSFYYTVTAIPGPLTAFEAGTASLSSADELDGYHLLAEAGSEKWYVATTTIVDTTDFTLANAHPDEISAIKSAGRDVWVFGYKSTQVYYNSGLADFPFTRHPAGVIDVGTEAPGSVAKANSVLFFLADDLSVRMTRGLSAPPISTPSIEAKIAGYDAPHAATGFTYTQEGHVFYVLTFPEVATWVYDVTTGSWHERRSDGRSDWRARHSVVVNDKILVGDAVNGNIYELDLDTYTENGTAITREAVSPPIHANGHWAFMNSFTLDMETGVGISTGQGSSPQVSVQSSDDGGKTWGSELWRDVGSQGDYGVRANWRRLGRFRERSLRVTMSDPVKVSILGAHADFTVGDP